ncbi:SMC-Scp complex subunit ScpB [Alloacidobacterium dinghuense]|uniref:SMC-Scp complex subunit ScpB n=1 Tax=Alloacidobacterium dinghuense TaxID=2763107 RepID=A0A7G8BHT2_9BACT|nr:SMC-Scp complex subunit ScpB [Alloacidobacterium dinghuense]QNI32102.1 SMC-Scp complex subunit ScpB [Alloacidobacterium dinghuense]
MSLKAKIEAVIYAAEEPVTLAQLAGLFGDEALEEKRAREAAARVIEPANEVSVVLTTESVGPDDGAVPAEAIAQVVEEEYSAPLTVEEAAVMAAQASEEGVTVVEAVVEQEPDSTPPEDDKRAARLRDREVRDELRRVVGELIADYAESDRGMEIREIAGGYRVGTKPEYHDAVRGFVKSLKPPMKLSLQALETLAVIAYKQPVTAPEVGEIRGVDSAGVIGSLISRKLITTAGRKQVIGRPILYKTTKEFLLRFGLKDVNELPSIEEFEKMAAGELSEPEELPFEESVAVPNEEGIVEAAADEPADEEESEAQEEAKAHAAVEMADESEDELEDFPGVAVELEVEGEEAEIINEATAEEHAEYKP